jgi:hypothetical protein
MRMTAQVNTLDRSIATVYKQQSEMYTAVNTNNAPMSDLWLKFPATCKIKINTVSAGTPSAVRCNVNVLMVIIQN